MIAQAQSKPLIALTMGDPCGIGPEVILRAMRSRRLRSAASIVIFGSEAVLRCVASEFRLRMPRVASVTSEDMVPRNRRVLIVDEVACPEKLALRGKPTAAGGRAAAGWIRQAVIAAQARQVHGMVTAPIHKEAMVKAGEKHAGHTEMLADLTGARKPVMMMVAEPLRVAQVTTHVAIRDLPRAITRSNVFQTIRVVHHDMQRFFGLPHPRLMVCGLNPHAGEGGLFGEEERKAIRPAVRRAAAEGIRCEGPVPADAVFTRRMMPRYDVAIAMFHDQANIPVKLLSFRQGVNVTLGLPIVRTSPAHGTAFDIVREGRADARSLVEAVCTAARMSVTRSAGS